MMIQGLWDRIWINGSVATCAGEYGLIEHAAVAIKDGRFVWVGSMTSLPGDPMTLAREIYDMEGRCMTPGLIDCHTHLVYAGNRACEFERRLEGVTYETIAREGGGIQSTVRATRETSEEELYQLSVKRAAALLASGVTTVEIKSGYGLNLETEEKILRVAQRIGRTLPLSVHSTFLGAHAVPVEYCERADDYINYICEVMIPKIAELKLATAVDVFCETVAFNIEQTERVFQIADQYGLRIKCHSEQLSDSKSAALAAKYAALSVDHLEYASEESIIAMAAAKTVAVLLPGAYYFLRETKSPPLDLLRRYHVPMAIATDCNPGTSPAMSLPLMMNMACTLFKMTPEETLLGVTVHAAKALGIQDDYGVIEVGKMADFVVWDIQHPAELSYYFGANLVYQTIKAGECI